MKLQTFIKALNSQDTKLARKFQKHVRELEEEPKGKFIAFVDDGKDSFDVAVEVGGDQNIINKQCDCPSGSAFCSHINAVCLAILEINKPKRKPRVKKLTKQEEIMQKVGSQKVMEWLTLQLRSDKVLAKKFEFDLMQDDAITAEALESMHKDLLRSINGKKQTITATDAGKVIKLYQSIHERIFTTQIEERLNRQIAIDLLIEIRRSIVELHYMLKRPSNKPVTYLNKLLDSYVGLCQKLNQKGQEEMIDLFYKDENILGLGIRWISNGMEMLDKVGSSVKLKFVESLFANKHIISGRHGNVEMLFLAFKGSDFINEIIDYFPIEMYKNEYNLELLDKLVELEKYESAVEKCLFVLERYTKYYGQPYFVKLIKTLLKINDHDRVFTYGKKYFRDFATYELYDLIKEAAPNDKELVQFYKVCKQLSPYNYEDRNGIALVKMKIYYDLQRPNMVFNIMEKFDVWNIPQSFVDLLIEVDRTLFISMYIKLGLRFWQLDKLYYDNLGVILLNNYTKDEVKIFMTKYKNNRSIIEVLNEVISTIES